MRDLILTLLCALMTAAAAVAQPQPPDTLWTKIYNLSDTRSAGTHFSATSDGGFIITGTADSLTYNDRVFLLKTDSLGNEQWRKHYYGGSFSYAKTVLQTSDGGYIFCGNKTVTESNKDVWVFKTDSLGNIEWSNLYGGEYDEYGNCMTTTSDGGYAIVGMKSSPITSLDIWMFKINPSGAIVWDTLFIDDGSSYGNWIVEADDGGLTIIGNNGSAMVIKTDANGAEQWRQHYEGSYDRSEGHSIDQTSDGGYILACGSEDISWPYSYHYSYIIKTDSCGIEEWSQEFDYYSNGSVVRQSANGFVISYPEVLNDLVGYDDQGNHMWDFQTSFTLYYFQLISDGGYLACGYTNVAYGILQAAIARTSQDYLSVSDLRQKSLADFTLHPPHPNPFNAETLISFDLPVSSQVELAVYDVAGREVAELENRELSAGNHVVPFNGGNLTSGIYFVRLSAGDFMQTRKCVLVK